MPKGRSYDLKPRTNRWDYFCRVCKEVFSIYNGRRDFRGKVPFCPWCGETIDVEKHKPLKHGGVTGRRHWSISELNLLQLLQQPLTWEQITVRFEGKHNIQAIRKVARLKGWQKKFDMSKRSEVTAEIKQKFVTDPRPASIIAKEYGVDKSTVNKYRKRFGGESIGQTL